MYSFINNLLEAKEPMHTELNGFCNDFPVNLIIEEEKEVFPRVEYKPELFVFDEIDFSTRRMFSAPLSLVFMPNNNCYTKCIYCYAAYMASFSKHPEQWGEFVDVKYTRKRINIFKIKLFFTIPFY